MGIASAPALTLLFPSWGSMRRRSARAGVSLARGNLSWASRKTVSALYAGMCAWRTNKAQGAKALRRGLPGSGLAHAPGETADEITSVKKDSQAVRDFRCLATAAW